MSYLCSIMRIIEVIFIFLAIRWIFIRFISPILKLTRMTHQKMNEMNNQMNQGQNKPKPETPQRKKEGEYIDYEEVK